MTSEIVELDTGRKKPYKLEITTQDVPMHGLPESLHGITVVHLSDLHGGFANTQVVHEEAIARVNALRPDLLLFTGDYIDDHSCPKDYPMHEILSRFHRARLGVFGCFGNHDHRRGIVGSRRLLAKSGIQELYNESVCVGGGLWIAGVDDLFEGQPDLTKTLADVPNDRTSILLSHNPRCIERVPDRDVVVLSGHTHGGQIALPFPSPRLICWLHLRCRQVAGWYSNGRARIYVNRGLGVTGKPFRYKCPAEISIFRLVPDTNSLRQMSPEKAEQPLSTVR